MKIYNYVNEQLELLGKTTIPDNSNYLKVIRAIPQYFKSNDLFMCMITAFNFGEMKGRECERDFIKWNALATFYNLKAYANLHNGKLPKTFNDLKQWEEAYYNQPIKNESKTEVEGYD